MSGRVEAFEFQPSFGDKVFKTILIRKGDRVSSGEACGYYQADKPVRAAQVEINGRITTIASVPLALFFDNHWSATKARSPLSVIRIVRPRTLLKHS